MGSVLITAFALEQVGGWGNVVSQVSPEMLSLIRPPGDPGVPWPGLVYPTLMFDLLPAGILGLVAAGFAAALMSQIDSTLNSASTLVTMDFVRRWKPAMSPHQLMRVGQAVTAVFMFNTAYPQDLNAHLTTRLISRHPAVR